MEISRERAISEEIDEMLKQLYHEEKTKISEKEHKMTKKEKRKEKFLNKIWILSEHPHHTCVIKYGGKKIRIKFADEQTQNRYTSPDEISFYVFGDDGYLKDKNSNLMLFIEPVEYMRKTINDCYNNLSKK